jgi:hypothetical protein
MSQSECPRGGPEPPADAPSRPAGRSPSRGESYPAPARKHKQPRREHYPNLSPTRAPAVAADMALWPLWAHFSVEDLNYSEFDDDGNLLPGRVGVFT